MAWSKFIHYCVLAVVFHQQLCSVGAATRRIKEPAETAKDKEVVPKTTLAPFKFDIIIDRTTTPKPKRNPWHRRRCCRIGRLAARYGYSCYIKRNIALIRINMPQRYKMKLAVKGDKWGYPFARSMEFCAKSHKNTRKFNHCCDKEARQMDRRRSGK